MDGNAVESYGVMLRPITRLCSNRQSPKRSTRRYGVDSVHKPLCPMSVADFDKHLIFAMEVCFDADFDNNAICTEW